MAGRSLVIILGAVALWAGGSATAAPGARVVECAKPRTLRLVRYEDRSAKLYCARRVLVRISVPY